MATQPPPQPGAAPGVGAAQRFTRRQPCPICGGHGGLPRGEGRRCHGFLSSDGRYAHCSREEHAGPLPLESASLTYAHRLDGDCRCGQRHGPIADCRVPSGRRIAESGDAGRKRSVAPPPPAQAQPAREKPDAAPQSAIPNPQSAMSYPYHDADGKVLYEVVRQPDKRFFQRAPDGVGGWRPSVRGVAPVLYRLVGLITSAAKVPVFIVEGEKDADALAALGLVATTNPGGAGKWRDTYTNLLRGRHIAILPDNDEPGRQHATQVAAALDGTAASIRVIALPGLPPRGDVSDWLAAGGTADELRALVRAAPPWRGWARYSATLLADVAAETVAWLSPGRLARGKITVLDGDPGLGKSTLVADWAAALTRGAALPGGAPADPAGVVLLSAEDGLGDTIRPRLEAAGADLARVLAVTGIADEGLERLPSFPDDLPFIEEAVARVDAALVVVDPLMAYLGPEVNSFRDQDVRRALAPLAALAERTGAAVLVIRHLNKAAGGAALYRGGGSIGIIGAARCGLLLAADLDDPERRVLAPTKSNLAVPPPALAFRLETAPGAQVARVAWLGEVACRADQLLAAPPDEDARDALEEARAFLRELLADGPVAAETARAEARKAGIAEATLRRAKAGLGVRSEKTGFQQPCGWSWALPTPDEGARPDEGVDSPEVSAFGADEHLRAVARFSSGDEAPTNDETPPRPTRAFTADEHLRAPAERLSCEDAHHPMMNDVSAAGSPSRESAPAHEGAQPVEGAQLRDNEPLHAHEHLPAAEPTHRCPACGKALWFRRPDGSWVCGLCNPPWGE